MKKILMLMITLVVVSTLFLCGATQEGDVSHTLKEQLDFLNIEQFDGYLDEETAILLGNRTSKELINDILSGKILKGEEGVKGIFGVIKEELFSGIKGVSQIVAIILISGILTAFGGEGDQNSKKIANGICTLCCVLVTMNIFTHMVKDGFQSIERVTTLVRVLVPVMAGMLIWSGKAISATSMPVVVMFVCTIVNELMKNIFIPVIYGYVAISCSNVAFDDKRFGGFADFLKSFLIWGMGLCFTIFAGIMTLQASALRIADGTVVRTVKYTVSSFVPFVGKILSDVSEIVMGCGNMISGAFGIFGIVICVVICGMPVIRALLYSLLYRLLAAFSQMVGCDALTKMLGNFSVAFTLLFALSASVSVIFMISFAMVAGGGK